MNRLDCGQSKLKRRAISLTFFLFIFRPSRQLLKKKFKQKNRFSRIQTLSFMCNRTGGEHREVKNKYGYLTLVVKTEGQSSLDRCKEALRDNITMTDISQSLGLN
jgi:hypothetical protein